MGYVVVSLVAGVGYLTGGRGKVAAGRGGRHGRVGGS